MAYKIQLYPEWRNSIEELSLEDKWKILENIFLYNRDSVIPHSWYIEIIFNFMKNRIDHDKKEYENRQNAWKNTGILWWRPKKDWDNSQKGNERQKKVKKPISISTSISNNINNNIIPPSEDFENFWKLFPHARKWKKKESMLSFSKLSSAEVMEEIKLLNWRVEVWLQNPQYIPACERWIRDFTKTSPLVMENLFEAMIAHLKKYEWDERRKLSARMKKDFGEDVIKEKWDRYWKSEPIKLKFKNDNGKVTTF